MTAFEITKEMIVGMKDEQLRQLLRRLLEAEARARNIPLSGIAVGGNQTAGDGGVDGSIAWTGLPTLKVGCRGERFTSSLRPR